MAIDETITRPKSTRSSTMTERENTNIPARMGHLLARKHRIEHWAYKGRSLSITDTTTTSSAVLGIASVQKRSESSYLQSGRILNIQLLQLSEQRQKAIERNNFDQKLFANKQALKYKDNQNVLRTLSYVRKCCKYADKSTNEKDNIDPKIFLEENSIAKRRRSRSRSPSATPPTIKRNLSANARTQTSASMAETFLRHNKKHLGSYGSSPLSRKLTESKTPSYAPTTPNPSETPPVDDDSQKRHVQFQINSDGTHLTSQSALVISKSNIDKQTIRNIKTAHGIRSSNSSHDTRTSISAPLIRTITSANEPSNEEIKQSSKPKRPLSRISSVKSAIQEFRLHPERFLSASNRYLPLLRRQALEVESKRSKDKNDSSKKSRINFSPPISRLSDGSDLTYDDAKSFLSEDIETGKNTPHSQQQQQPGWLEQDRKTNKRRPSSNKIDMMEKIDDDNDILERRMALSRLRDREYAHLNELIRSNPIEQILEPLSTRKTDENDQIDAKQQKKLNYQRHSISSTTRIRQLSEILHSIDSLRCSDTVDGRARRQVDIEKNRAKLGILIF